MFSNGDTIFGCRPLKFTPDTGTATTQHRYRFCDGWNIYTIVEEDLATDDTACAVILSEESALIAATNKDTRAATPISVSNFTDPSQKHSHKPSNFPYVFLSAGNSDDPRYEP